MDREYVIINSASSVYPFAGHWDERVHYNEVTRASQRLKSLAYRKFVQQFV